MSTARNVWTRLKQSRNPIAVVIVRALKATAGVARTTRERIRESRHPAIQFVTSPHFRWKLWVRLFKPEGVHQVAARTRMDRYPEIFALCRDHFGREARIDILSFGCSTGEEVLTLRHYFPDARIVGAEINPHSLSVCHGLTVDDRIAFIRSDPDLIESRGPFDLIFCMAVLQRDPQLVTRKNVRSLRRVYMFDKFDQQLQQIDRWLRMNGVLVLHHAHYLLSDSSVASRYAPLPSAAHLVERYAKFGRDSELISTDVASQSIFVKTAPAGA